MKHDRKWDLLAARETFELCATRSSVLTSVESSHSSEKKQNKKKNRVSVPVCCLSCTAEERAHYLQGVN